MAGKRPSLAESMRQAAQAEPLAAPAPISVAVVTGPVAVPMHALDPAVSPTADAKPAGFYAATRAGKKKVTAALDPAVHKRLKGLAVAHDTTTEALLHEAIADLFKKHG